MQDKDTVERVMCYSWPHVKMDTTTRTATPLRHCGVQIAES